MKKCTMVTARVTVPKLASVSIDVPLMMAGGVALAVDWLPSVGTACVVQTHSETGIGVCVRLMP